MHSRSMKVIVALREKNLDFSNVKQNVGYLSKKGLYTVESYLSETFFVRKSVNTFFIKKRPFWCV